MIKSVIRMANKVKQLQVSLFKQLSVMHVKTVVSYEKNKTDNKFCCWHL